MYRSMKKLTAITAAMLIAAATAGAQNRTPIGSRHAIDFGVYYGYGGGNLANHAGGFMDINARRSGLRTRLGLEIEQAAVAFCPGGYAELMYMFPLDKTLNLYPLVGVQAEFHDEPAWPSVFDVAPEAGAGLEFQFGGNFGFFLQAKYKYGVLGVGSTFMGQTGFVFAFGPGGRERKIAARGAELAEALRAKDEADDARHAEALEQARLKAEQEAAEAREAAAAEKAAMKTAAEKAAAERMTEQMAAAAASSGKVAARLTHEDIFFKHTSAVLDINAWQQIDDLVEALKRDTEAKISLCGYADKSEGTEQNCLSYAEKRVENISNAFKAKGIDGARISTEIIGSAIAPYQMPESNRVVTVDLFH